MPDGIATWKERRMEDGTYTGVLVFPETMTEEQALATLDMDGRELNKLGEIHNGHDKTRACQYLVTVSAKAGDDMRS